MGELCGHCASSALEHKGFVTTRQWTEDHGQYGELSFQTVVAVVECESCRELTIWRGGFCDEVGGDLSGQVQLYPAERRNDALPARVRERLSDAAKAKGASASAYAVAVRRVVETICNQEGATGDTLFAKLDDLATNGRLPKELADMGHQIRQFGNLGAHDFEDDVTPGDLPAIEQFMETLLDFCYRGPAKVEAVRQRLNERKNAPSA